MLLLPPHFSSCACAQFASAFWNGHLRRFLFASSSAAASPILHSFRVPLFPLPRSVHFMDGGGSIFYLCLGSRDKRSADYLGSFVRPWCSMVRGESTRKCSSFLPIQRKLMRLLTILALGREDYCTTESSFGPDLADMFG